MAEMGTVKIVFNSSTFAGGIVQRWVNDGCLWTSYASLGAGSQGTSNSAPLVASALASVLAVFPDTAPVELAKFAKACAKRSGTDKRGNTIAALLRQSGGVGVADFTCMGDTTTALANLPNGGSTRVTINGKPVTVSGRDLVLSFGNMMQSVPVVGQDGFSLIPVVTDEQSIMFVGIWKGGSYFASTGSGLRGDFFGFTEGHREVFDLQVTAGHENAFIRFSDQQSKGGDIIKSARAQSLGFTLRKSFSLTEETTLGIAAHTDRFLGGKAKLPVGTVRLREGGWNHRLSLSAERSIGEEATFRVGTDLHLPEMGEQALSLGVQYTRRF